MLKPSISLESFPLCDLDKIGYVTASARPLVRTKPDFFQVTFGIAGETVDSTFDAAKILEENSRVAVAPHISCRDITRDKAPSILDSYLAAGLNRLVIFIGDIPRWISKRMNDYYSDSEALKEFGVEVLTQLSARLIGEGVPRIHYFTLNKTDAVLKMCKNLNLID